MNIDVWTIEHDPRQGHSALAACLSPDELARADRLRILEKRSSFIFNRALLRRVLASYLDLEPSEVPLTASSTGKPELAEQQLFFNLTHCRDLGLLAVSRSGPMGIDLEALDASNNYDALALQALSPAEYTAWQRLPRGDQPAAILRAWTRKEAYLKAVGLGFARPPGDIQVTFLEDEPTRLLVTGDADQAPADWTLRSWAPRVGWFAAVAARTGGVLHLEIKSAASLRDRNASPGIRSTAAAVSN